MSISVAPRPLFTIGEVRRQLAEAGLARSASAIRKLELRGLVSPQRPVGQDRRLYTDADVALIMATIRERETVAA